MREYLRIQGGRKLEGKVEISGAKNAALPIMIAAVLSKQKLILHNIPHISDIVFMTQLLVTLGVKVTLLDSLGNGSSKTLMLDASNISTTEAPYDLVIKMRASIWLLGALLGRFGEAKVPLPGGCAIGGRPIDLHLHALSKMGTDIIPEEGYIVASSYHKYLRGAEIKFRKKSVGATENVILAAVLAKGTTIIDNASVEPEIGDLAKCLIAMGAKIEGVDTEHLVIEGVEELHEAEYTVMPDRIETGTYAIASLITNGDLVLQNISLQSFQGILPELQGLGAKIEEISPQDVRVTRQNGSLQPIDVCTAVFPGFPTDLQSPITALLSTIPGHSTITETIYENRFMHVEPLQTMGANLTIEDNTISVQGVATLRGAEVTATELRSGVSLVLAGLVAEGQTIVNNVYYIQRGYERLVEKLTQCGADIHLVCQK